MDRKEDIKRYINEIATSLINNNAAVMIGSGFSKNAKKISYNPKQKFCDWNELADKFYIKLFGDIDSKNIKYYNPLALAEEVETIYGRPVLESILKDSIPDSDYIPDTVHNELLSLPWKDIFTTNYDTLLERASENIITTTYNVINCKEDLVNSSSTPRIIKLHGSFPSYRPFIITEEDYRTYPHDFAPFVNTAQQALIENTFCMIGFSCDDPNFLKWIGWMNDHLGKNHTQNIYMISLSGENEAKQKKLLDKNIRLVNLEILWSDKTHYEKINNFIMYLRNKINENKNDFHWSTKEDVKFFSNSKCTTDMYIAKLNQLRKKYLGWITLPKSERNNIWNIMECIYKKLVEIKKEKKENEIEFIYEYVLFKQIINIPILREEGLRIMEVLERNTDGENLKKEKYQTIFLQLLRFCRENSMINDWNKFNNCIDTDIIKHDQLQFWEYEKCMFQLFQFNAEELKKSVNNWRVDARDFTWSLKKSYLLVQLGELHKAKELAMKSFDIIRKRIVREREFQCILISYESCFMALIGYLNQATYDSKSDNIINKVERNSNDYDWYRENEYYELLLKSKYDFVGNSEIDLEFDLNKRTYKYSFGVKDDDAINSFQYLRFREETGHPLKRCNMVDNKAIVGVISRIVRYNPMWSVLISVMARNKEGLDYIFNRKFLFQYSMEEVDELCSNYLKILKESLDNVNPKNWFNPSNIFEYATALMPYVISRLASKCSLEKLDEILDISLIIYKNTARNNIKEMDKLISHLMDSYTTEQQINRIGKLCEFPLIEEYIIDQYPDPILYININSIDKKIILEEKEYEKCIKSLIRDLKFSDKKDKKINRLLRLYFIVEFNSEDVSYIKELIWRNNKERGIPKMYNFYSTELFQLPKNDKIDLKSRIKENVIKNYSDEIDKKKLSNLTDNTDEVLQLVYKKIIGLNKLPQIIELSIKHYDNIIMRKEYDFFGSADAVERHLKKDRDIIFSILLNELENKDLINTDLRNDINKYTKKLEDGDISVVNLKLGANLFFDNKINFYNDIVDSILSSNSDDVIGSMKFLLNLRGKNIEQILEKEEYSKIIDLIAEKILFKSINCDINIVCFYIELIKKLEFQQFINSEKIILYLIETLRKQTIINEKDNINVVKGKCEMRKVIAELSFVLYKKYFKYNNADIPTEICRWKEVCKSKEEFVEIRKAWEDFK